MIRYLTGASSKGSEAIAFERGLGLMIQPGNGYHAKVDLYPFWAADNGAFTRTPGGFNEESFRRMLNRPMLREHAASCLFVVAPDELVVLEDGTVIGDAMGTLMKFHDWALEIRAAGFPVALVAQNGLEKLLHCVPWGMVDVLFLGGGPDPKLRTRKNPKAEWKLSEHARVCAVEARQHGKLVHMGRVNSLQRIERASEILCDTADGTFLMFGPKKNLPELLSWLDAIRRGMHAHFPWGGHS